MTWKKIVWTLTTLVIWVLALMIVEVTAKQTRIGYKINKLRIEREIVREKNKRLHCEVAVLYDLKAVNIHAASSDYVNADLSNVAFAENDGGFIEEL